MTPLLNSFTHFLFPLLIIPLKFFSITIVPTVTGTTFIFYFGNIEFHDSIPAAEEGAIVFQRIETCPKRTALLPFRTRNHPVILLAFFVGEELITDTFNPLIKCLSGILAHPPHRTGGADTQPEVHGKRCGYPHVVEYDS